MITQDQLAAAVDQVECIDTPGLRKLCCFCKTDLVGSDPTGTRASHGICNPICEPARAMGWEQPT